MKGRASMTTGKRLTENRALLSGVLVILSVAVYFWAFRAGFFFDDYDQIVGNRWITDFKYLPDIFTSSVWDFLSSGGHKEFSNYYRPLMHLTYMAGYHIFGLSPLGFHIVNLAFHAANTVLVFVILSRLTNAQEEGGPIFPFMGAAVFAVTPVNVETVTWIAAVPELSFVFFCLLSFYFYISFGEGKGAVNLALSVFFYMLAMLSKETAVTFPLLLVLFHYPFRRPLSVVKGIAPFVVATLAFLYVRSRVLGPAVATHPMDGGQYILTVVYLFGEYMEKLVLPFGSQVYSPFIKISGAGDLNLMGLFLILILAGAVVFSILKRPQDAGKALMGFFWIFAPILPAILLIKFIQGERIFAERYLYFSSIGFALLLAVFMRWLSQNPFKGRKAVPFVLFLVVLVAYSTGTIVKARVWTDNYLYWRQAALDAPESATVYANLGTAHTERKEYGDAIQAYRKAAGIKPFSFEIMFNLATAYAGAGMTEDALKTYGEALPLTSSDVMKSKIYSGLGDLYRKAGLMTEAIANYEKAAALDRSDTLLNRLGIAYATAGDLTKAEAAFRAALEVNPGSTSAARNLERLRSAGR